MAHLLTRSGFEKCGDLVGSDPSSLADWDLSCCKEISDVGAQVLPAHSAFIKRLIGAVTDGNSSKRIKCAYLVPAKVLGLYFACVVLPCVVLCCPVC